MSKSKKANTSCCFVLCVCVFFFCFCCYYWSTKSMESNQQSPGSIHTLHHPPLPHPLQKGVEIARGRSLKCPLEKGQGTILDEELYILLPLKPYVSSTLFCNLSSWLKIQVCHLISSMCSCNSWSLLSLSVLVCKQALHLWLLVNSPNKELDRGLKLSPNHTLH